MTYEAESPRLYLQRLTVEEHLDDFHELWNDPRGLVWSSHPAQKTVEETRPFMLKNLPEQNPDTDKFAILLKPIEENPKPWVNARGAPKLIGMVGTNRWSAHGMETGYCINVRYWGKGYGGEAFRLFLSLYWTLPERKEMKYLVAKAVPENIASTKIIQRAGARKGELLKERYGRFGDGEGTKKMDANCWYLDRPGYEEENLKEWEKRDFEELDRKEREAGEEYARKVREEAEKNKEKESEEKGP